MGLLSMVVWNLITCTFSTHVSMVGDLIVGKNVDLWDSKSQINESAHWMLTM
jgi:hypothetical protein